MNTRQKAVFALFILSLTALVWALPGLPSPARAQAPLARRFQSTPQAIAQVETLPPNDDGSITHVIRYGETLIDIAQAYGITLNELYARNRSLNPLNPSYFEGDILVIRAAFTATPFMTETYTPPPPTNTPRPTRTPRPTATAMTLRTSAPSATPRAPTATPLFRIPSIDDLGESRPTIAISLIVISAIGLVVLVLTAFLPGRK